MINMPVNFDGDKFLAKFGDVDFRAVDGLLVCSSLPNLTEADIADCVMDMVAYHAQKTDEQAARDSIRAEYLSTIDTLRQIENTVSPTNAQVVQAVRFLAKTLRLLLRLLVRRYV